MEVKEVFVFCLMCKDEHVGHMSLSHINMWYKFLCHVIFAVPGKFVVLLIVMCVFAWK